jgi:AbiV family abortive infection protein
MVSGRALYRQLADASDKNARELLRNAYDLKSWGSRGHACSLAVLAIEESAKAFVYYIASEGVVRIVRKNPNNLTTYKESDLLDHEFKHLLITGLLEDIINYGPFYEAIARIQKESLSRADVVRTIYRAIHAHQRQRLDFQSGGKRADEVKRIFQTLKTLNRMKNQGLYVGHKGNHVLAPNAVERKELKSVLDLADIVVEVVSISIKSGLDPAMKRAQVEELRKTARKFRRLRARKPTKAASKKDGEDMAQA